MFRRIVVAVDSSADSRVIARVAAALARATRGRVRACAVIDVGLVAATPAAFRDRLRDELRRESAATLREVRTICRGYGVPMSGVVADGHVAQAVLAVARRFRADLIVLASRGFGRVRVLLGGSVAVDLVASAPCAVLLVRRGSGAPAGARQRHKRRRP